MAPHARRRADSADRYDIGNGVDIEKARRYSTSSDSATDDNDDDESSPQSSRDGYNSREPMLPRSSPIKSKHSPRPSTVTIASSNKHHSPVRHRHHRSSSSSHSHSYSYRVPHRTMRWLCIALLSSIVIFIGSLWRMSALSQRHLEEAMRTRPKQPELWEGFNFLKRYYGGLRTLVPLQDNRPEYPVDGGKVDWERPYGEHKKPIAGGEVVVDVYPKYSSQEYLMTYEAVEECFLEEEERIRVPMVRGYHGVTEGFPKAIIGSYDVLGIDEGICYDRFGKLGPYGYGYSLKRGGSGVGMDGERQGAQDVWEDDPGYVDYRNIKWHDLQKRCFEKNKKRFNSTDEEEGTVKKESFRTMPARRSMNETAGSLDLPGEGKLPPSTFVDTSPHAYEQPPSPKQKLPRTAVVIRTWRDYKYTPEAIIYLRSMISELSLRSGGEYTVHFLIHVKDDNHPIWADEELYNKTLQESLPEEFWGMGTLWSERQMGLIYGGLAESFYRDLPVHGVYRSAHFPLQWFAHNHAEYDFFWNWEMDVRYTGQWYDLFSSLARFADAQPRKGLWERNARFYIPSEHGSWDDFRHTARVQSNMPPPADNPWVNTGPPPSDAESPPNDATPPSNAAEQPIWGPVRHPDTPKLPTDPEPPTPYAEDDYTWGVGEPADLITLNPLFDPAHTTWLLAEDTTGYDVPKHGFPPRRTAIVTTARLSRRLLATMHRETATHRHTMFSEMFPGSMALQHGLKAVYAPHPVFVDRAWPTAHLAKTMNGGLNGATGGARTSVFGALEHNLRGVTWYYNSGFSENLWKRWLGKRVDGGGGEMQESSEGGEGRMCLPGVLLHPVKEVELAVEEIMAGEDRG